MILNQSKNIKFNKTNTETWKVYFLIDNNEVVYIGCTNNIIKRLDFHANWYNPYNSVRTKMYVGKKEFDSYRYIEINDKTKAYKLESKLIKKYRPKYNDKRNYYWKQTQKKFKTHRGIWLDLNCNHKYFYKHIVVWSPIKKKGRKPLKRFQL